MKCPQCGAWNQAYLPKCNRCGRPLTGDAQKKASWEESMHKKKPSLEILEYDEQDTQITPEVPDEEPMYDPDRVVRSDLTDELEELAVRRQRGRSRLDQMKSHADSVRRSIQEVEIIRPKSETEDSAQYAADAAAIRRRQELRQNDYMSGAEQPTPASAQ